MPAPREIVDGFETILDVFVSNIRHRERVAFILSDNLVELACKTKAHQADHRFDRTCGFHAAWNAPSARLAPAGLGGRVQTRRDTRNTMQHGSAAVTVNAAHCADSIVDTCRVINTLWRNTTERMLRPQYQCALRIVHLYCSDGDARTQQRFEDQMRQGNWRGIADERQPRVAETIVEPGVRGNWWYAVHESSYLVDQVLDAIVAEGNGGDGR